MFCTKCGSELPEGVRHCFVCGAAVRQLPPLRTGQDFPAGQPGQTTPAPPYGTAGQQGQPQNRPAYQSPAYQTLQSQPLPTWPPRPENNAAASPAPGPAYTTSPGQAGPPPPVPPMVQSGPDYPAYHHSKDADTPDTVGMLEWLWSSLVMLVPMLNFILLAVWAFGIGAKPSKRNWARAMLILYLVLFLLFVGWNVYLAMTGQLSFAP